MCLQPTLMKLKTHLTPLDKYDIYVTLHILNCCVTLKKLKTKLCH